MKQNSLPIIGANTLVSIEGVSGIPAKIDTGADSSSVHVENIDMSESGVLSFNLLKKSGKIIETTDYKVAVVRSSNGSEELRYRAPLSLELGGKKIRATFSLSDRSKNNFPVLIGRKTIKGKFLVDVSEKDLTVEKNPKTPHFNKELRENPYEFHKKYVITKERRENETSDSE